MRLFALGPKGEPHRDGQAARACLNRDSPGPCKPRGPLTAPGWALMGVTVCPACGQGQGCMGQASALSEEPTVWEESAPREREFGGPGHGREVGCVCGGGGGGG